MEWKDWEVRITQWVEQEMASADSGHGIDHIRRVVQNATRIARNENAEFAIVIPACWLHDCVSVPKNSPLRSSASRLAAEKATAMLRDIGYPSQWIELIAHCILAHSFSAKIACETLEARVVQDADRLEAVGAIGMARCFMTGGSLGQRLYHPDDPFPVEREYRDNEQSIDHFFAKLLGLHRTMQTESGREIARQRTAFLVSYLVQLGSELGVDERAVLRAVEHAGWSIDPL